jgi:hypothetical protein
LRRIEEETGVDEEKNEEKKQKPQLLFPARGKDTPFAGWSKGKPAFDTGCAIEPWTLHDLRRTCATNLAALGVPVHVTEKFLNHVSGTTGGIVAVYQRHTYIMRCDTLLTHGKNTCSRCLKANESDRPRNRRYLCAENDVRRYLAEFDFRYNDRVARGVHAETRGANPIKGRERKRLTHRTIGDPNGQTEAQVKTEAKAEGLSEATLHRGR